MTTLSQSPVRATQRTLSVTLSNSALLRPLAFAVLVFCAAIWGGGTVLSKYTLTYFSPSMLLLVELSSSCLTLWGILLITGRHRQMRLSDWRHGIGGLLEPGLAYMLMTAGLAHTSASNSTLILALEALMTGVLAWVLLGEKLQRAFWLCSGIALVGVVLLSSAGAADGTSASLLGDMLMLLGTLAASFYVVVSRYSVSKISPVLLAAVQHTTGLVVVVLMVAAQGEALVTTAPLHAWLLAGFSGMMQYAVAFILYLAALRYVAAGKSAIFLLLIPVFGVASAVLFLGESLSLGQVVGGTLIIAALLPVQLAGDEAAAAGKGEIDSWPTAQSH